MSDLDDLSLSDLLSLSDFLPTLSPPWHEWNESFESSWGKRCKVSERAEFSSELSSYIIETLFFSISFCKFVRPFLFGVSSLGAPTGLPKVVSMATRFERSNGSSNCSSRLSFCVGGYFALLCMSWFLLSSTFCGVSIFHFKSFSFVYCWLPCRKTFYARSVLTVALATSSFRRSRSCYFSATSCSLTARKALSHCLYFGSVAAASHSVVFVPVYYCVVVN